MTINVCHSQSMSVFIKLSYNYTKNNSLPNLRAYNKVVVVTNITSAAMHSTDYHQHNNDPLLHTGGVSRRAMWLSPLIEILLKIGPTTFSTPVTLPPLSGEQIYKGFPTSAYQNNGIFYPQTSPIIIII